MSTDRSQLERLRAGAARLRSAGRDVPVERLLARAGAAFGLLGVGLILLGWYGASRTPYVFEQMPYMISGGLLGLGLVVIGGFAYFAYWLTRIAQEARGNAAAVTEAIERLAFALAPAASDPAPVSNGSFLATKTGTLFHRADCAVVAGRAGVRKVQPGAGLEPCALCKPLG